MRTQSHTFRRILLLSGFITAIGAATPLWAGVCSDAVQGNIAWNKQGNTNWAQGNVDQLCAGAEDSAEPANCFKDLMHGGVTPGEANEWTWRPALDLCAGTQDAAGTIDCYNNRIAAGLTQAEAISACKWDTPAPSNQTAQLGAETAIAKDVIIEGMQRPIGSLEGRVPLQLDNPNVKVPLRINRGANAKTVTVEAGVTERHVLTQFSFEYLANDRHLDAVGVLQNSDGTITTTFGDKEYHRDVDTSGFVFDNPYADFFKRGGDQWAFDHQFVEMNGDIEIGQVNNYNCRDGGRCVISIPQREGMVFVLRGFEFDFDREDRHIQIIRLVGNATRGEITVNYRDQSPDDPYRVTVQYAYMPREWLAQDTDDPRRGWDTQFQYGGSKYFDLDDDKNYNLVISGFLYSHPSATDLLQEFLKTGPARGKLDQSDGHVRKFWLKTKSDYDRHVSMRLTDDQYPQHMVRPYIYSIDPRRVK